MQGRPFENLESPADFSKPIPGLEQAGVCRYTLSSSEELTYVSDSFLRLCGYSQKSIKKKFKNDLSRMVVKAHRKAYRAAHKAWLTDETTLCISYCITCKDGNELEVSSVLNSHRKPNGKLVGIALVYPRVTPNDSLAKQNTQAQLVMERADDLRPTPLITKTFEIITPANERTENIFIRTFGYFDVFVQGQAVVFGSAKAKELLALLVDQRGGVLTANDIIPRLWPSEEVNDKTRARLRTTAMRMKQTLEQSGIAHIVQSVGGKRSFNTSAAQCDLYDYLAHREGVSYYGTYMHGYRWAHETRRALHAQEE